MKITIIQGAFLPVPPIMGGACEKIWLRLGREFALAGHEVTHISRRHAALLTEEEIDGVRHIRVAGYDTPASLIKLKLLDLFYSRRACQVVPPDSDIVVTNTFWSPLLLSRSLAPKACVDVQRMPKGQIRWYRRARLRANSTPVAEAIRRELPASEHRRTILIPNPLPFTVAESLGEMKKRSVLLYCGRVHPEKGLHLLIKAMRLVKNPWPLRIVGPWQTGQGGGGVEYKNQLVREAQDLPVTFVGPVHQADALNNEYRDAAVFIYPSIAEKGETFGSAPLEAMAWGCAPIVSDLACFKDFIHAGVNGLVFDHRCEQPEKSLAQAMQQLMEDDSTRLGLSQTALKVRETHSPESIARLFLNDFDSISRPMGRM